MIEEATTLPDVAGAVADALRQLEYDPVVVGGSAATMHAPEAYRSADVDMVVIGGIENNAAFISKMASIGFLLKNGMFIHELSPYTVDFVPSPVAIAGDVIDDFATLETNFGPVRVLHAVDVVKDRLNKYVVYRDPESFEVAVAVARMKNVDLTIIDAFIKRQATDGYGDLFNSAFARLRSRLGLNRRQSSSIGFTIAFRIRFRLEPTTEIAEATTRGIQALLDEERAEIDPILDGITIRQTPWVRVNNSDKTIVTVPIEVRTKRDLAPVDRFALANAVVDYLRERLEIFPELTEVPDDGTPPVATSGL